MTRWILATVFMLPMAAWAGPWEGGVRFGLHTGGVRDDLLVPLGFGGAGLGVGGALDGRTGPGDLAVDLGMGGRLLSTRFGQVGLTIDHQIDVAWTVRLGDGTWTPSVGAAAAWDARMSFLESWDNAHGYWIGAQWLGPAARLRGPLGHARLDVGLSFALLGGAGRPPSYRYDKQDPLKRFTFWFVGPLRGEEFHAVDSMQVVRLETAVDLPGDKWTLGLDTRFVHVTVPDDAVDISAFAFAQRTWGKR